MKWIKDLFGLRLRRVVRRAIYRYLYHEESIIINGWRHVTSWYELPFVKWGVSYMKHPYHPNCRCHLEVVNDKED